MQKAADLRVQKTQEAIRNTLLNLIEEKGFDSVTVHGLCQRARVNRSTFYSHYRDKYDLLEKITKEAIGEILHVVNPETIVDGGGKIDLSAYRSMVLSLLITIQRDRLIYKTLLGVNGNYSFLKELKAVVEEKIFREWRSLHPDAVTYPISENLYLEIIVSIYVGTILWWIDRDFAPSPEQVAEQLVRYIVFGTSLVADFKPPSRSEFPFLYDKADKLSGKW